MKFILHSDLVTWMVLGSSFFFLFTLLCVPLILIRLPEDYFLTSFTKNAKKRAPWQTLPFAILRNLLGIALFMIGILMLITPGQGILTILVSLMLLSIPGKERYILRLIKNKHVNSLVTSLRAHANKKPLKLPNS